MRNFAKLTILFALATALCLAQTALTTTTLSSAVSTPTQSTVTLASGTGVTVQGAQNAINTVLYIDRELMRVISLVSGTTYTVQRGVSGTRPFVHASGARVYLGAPSGNFFRGLPSSSMMWGSCYAPNEISLPKIYVDTGDIFDCKNGTSGAQWIRTNNGTMAGYGQTLSQFCTGTVGSAETEYLVGAACSGATTSTATIIIANHGTLANLYVNSSANFKGSANKDVLTVYKNGSATTLTCTGAASTKTCSDTTHSVNVVPGDIITFQFVTDTTDTAANVAASLKLY